MGTEKIIWIISNLILILYAIILFIYGKYIRKKDSINFVKLFLTKNFLFNHRKII